MKQKQVIQILIVVGAIAFSFFNDWFGSEKKPTAPSQPKQEKSQAETSSVNKSAVRADYDFVLRNDPIGANKNAPFDHYMLALSWSPAFCETQQKRHGKDLPASAQMQCGIERQYGWVIHGLWPQNGKARSVSDHPRFCRGDLAAVDYQIIQHYLADSPSPHLLQGEWEKHGACAFNSAQQYWQKQQDLYRSLRLPTQEMSKKELFRWVKQHNPQLKNVRLNASRAELFICYDLNWQPMDCK